MLERWKTHGVSYYRRLIPVLTSGSDSRPPVRWSEAAQWSGGLLPTAGAEARNSTYSEGNHLVK